MDGWMEDGWISDLGIPCILGPRMGGSSWMLLKEKKSLIILKRKLVELKYTFKIYV